VLADAVHLRKKYRETIAQLGISSSQVPPFLDMNYITEYYPAALPEFLRPKSNISPQQMAVYDEFLVRNEPTPPLPPQSGTPSTVNVQPSSSAGTSVAPSQSSITSRPPPPQQQPQPQPQPQQTEDEQPVGVSSLNQSGEILPPARTLASSGSTTISTTTTTTPTTTSTSTMTGAVAPISQHPTVRRSPTLSTNVISTQSEVPSIRDIIDNFNKLLLEIDTTMKQHIETHLSEYLQASPPSTPRSSTAPLNSTIEETLRKVTALINNIQYYEHSLHEITLALAHRTFHCLYETQLKTKLFPSEDQRNETLTTIAKQYLLQTHLLILETLANISPHVCKELTNWLIYSSEEKKLNKDVILGLLRFRLLVTSDFDMHLVKLMDKGNITSVIISF
jgi:hypothetical protein